MKKTLITVALFINFGFGSSYANTLHKDRNVWIGIEPYVLKHLSNSRIRIFEYQDVISGNEETFFKVKESSTNNLSHFIHHKFKRCGGFRVLPGEPKDEKKLSSFSAVTKSTYGNYDFQTLITPDYSINQVSTVTSWLSNISEEFMTNIVSHLSTAYRTRYYKSPEGVASMLWIGAKWEEITKSRNDIKIKYFSHKNFIQPSVILTIEGSDPILKDQIIILGGHGDSINSKEEGYGAAPGADDNAAGIAVMSEILRNVVNHNYQPKHTIQFIAYAAEEDGLQGSYELAAFYRENKTKVLGIIQFDGVNYKGPSYDMIIYSDFSSNDQNQFLARLIDTYLKITWTWDKCQYRCSDHAAWDSEGYRASLPAEAINVEQNPFIHTPEDTMDKSNFGTEHAVLFVKLGIAYLIELDQ